MFFEFSLCRKFNKEAYKFILSFWDVTPLIIIHSAMFLRMYLRLKVFDLAELMVGRPWKKLMLLLISLLVAVLSAVFSELTAAIDVF